ncbi:MAG: hypothetical protein R6X23_03040 [Acidimicrobiia bacterium]
MVPQRLLVALLVIVTVGAGAWWVLLRSEPPPPGNFVRHTQQFADAARAVPASADQVTDVKSLRRWSREVAVHLEEMELAYQRIVQIQGRATEEAAEVADTAASTAASVIELVGVYRDEFSEGSLGPAESAARSIETLVNELDAQVRAWKQL